MSVQMAPLRVDAPLPSLEGATRWFNGTVTREELLGHPTLVHFWSVSCHICKETMPGVVEWKEKYAPNGLRMVGIHVPRQEEDTDVEQVAALVAQYQMKHPIAVDNELTLSAAFGNQFVPAFYVFDPDGKLRFRAGGDKGFQMVEGRIRRVCGLE